jgi:hypothetical protein
LWQPEDAQRGEGPPRERARRGAARHRGAQARSRRSWALTRVVAIGKPELRQFFDYARAARGHHMALAMIAAFSAAWSWGKESTLWRLPANPRDGMEFERPDGRIVLVPMAAFTALVGAADALGRPSVGDCLYLALFTGQRQTDRLVMPWSDGGNLGRLTFRQSKTDAVGRPEGSRAAVGPPARRVEAPGRAQAETCASPAMPIDHRRRRAHRRALQRHHLSQRVRAGARHRAGAAPPSSACRPAPSSRCSVERSSPS